MNNFFARLPKTLPEEFTERLASNGLTRIERIISRGHASPPGFWYDQNQHEWVMILAGRAKLRFEGEEKPLELGPGDWINIPPHKKHRVDWTTPDEHTLWLAVFY